ncbi:MAG: hypothetical protein HN742_03580 [Lentisphaerae bacterium]|jgi:hypothetical protein|nr:hypothetical protein [Lentisphaerota bacterium]MBT5609689.1 hypothetical protein [Lentisphaerota bacterium]MBT7054813.1 hypothetical protein [Lentisphaerota bacterium]MBT7840922.1 hypothetical protein [Lentisphaerota bacterium]
MPIIRTSRRIRTQKTPFRFAEYRPGKTLGPVTCVTPDDASYIHTFYDICPWSPSQRYLLVSRLPFQDREPVFGDTADVCLVDLHERTIETLYTTTCWGLQLGTQAQWGNSDRYVFTNDFVDGSGRGIRIDLESDEITVYSGPLGHISPDGSTMVGFTLNYMNATQSGYGMPDHPDLPSTLPAGAADDEGIWETDLGSGGTRLLFPLARGAEVIPNPERFAGGTYYYFMVKYNPQGTRILEILRCTKPDAAGNRHSQALTHAADGTDAALTVGYDLEQASWKRPDWAPGGHHISWTADGEHLTMNLLPDGKNLRFCRFRYDGSELEVLCPDILGSGHPRLHPAGRFLSSDAYTGEPVVGDQVEVPIRLIDLFASEEHEVCRIYTFGDRPSQRASVLRCDPHPAWSRDGNQLCFNGAPNGKRQVLIADLSGVV